MAEVSAPWKENDDDAGHLLGLESSQVSGVIRLRLFPSADAQSCVLPQ